MNKEKYEEIKDGTYKGKPIVDYSKKELITIIWEMDMRYRETMAQHEEESKI